jgi:hypothetical protein
VLAASPRSLGDFSQLDGRLLRGKDAEALLDGHALLGELVVGGEARGVGRGGGATLRGRFLIEQGNT